MMNNQNSWSNQQMMSNNYGYNQAGIGPRSVINGAFVNSENDIRPQDVPTNGQPAFFPLNNGQHIVVRYLDRNNVLQSDIYELVNRHVEPQNTVNESRNDQNEMETITKTLENINSRLNKLENHLKQVKAKDSYSYNKEGSK